MIGTTYSELKAYISKFVYSHPTIRTLVWGMSKRALELQPVYPYFWVEDYQHRGESVNNGSQVYWYWDLTISVKGNSPLDSVITQEYWLNVCQNIVRDFLKFLIFEHSRGNIIFDLNSYSALPQEVYEVEDNWGWSFRVRIGLQEDCYKELADNTKYDVSVLVPTFSGSAGNIALGINGNGALIYNWQTGDIPTMLNSIVPIINNAGHGVGAKTDGSYLYLISDDYNTDITLDIATSNTHSWTQKFS